MRMKKLMLIPTNSTFLILLAALFVSACVTYPPHRPVGVNEVAVWAGGRDGGVWVDCQDVSQGKNVFECSVFDELGVLLRQQDFRLVEVHVQNSSLPQLRFEQIARAVQLDEVRRIGFRAYDGEKLSLLNGWALIPEDSAD
jgi:hypothetical protein